VSSGPLKGADLYRIAATHGKEVFGPDLVEECTRDFPLLVKFIDASAVLSVQVHPADEYARGEGFAYGKSEAWVIVAADEGGCVYRGFAPGTTAASFREALDAGDVASVEACLNKVVVKPGDVIDLPAGVVHAIGPGLLLCEIQQSCDLTYRVYDWGRVGLDGKPRELHLDKAFDVMAFEGVGTDTAAGQAESSGGVERTVYRDGYPFHLETASCEGDVELATPPDRFEIICVLSGTGRIVSPTGDENAIEPGQSVLVPASWDGYKVVADGPLKWVRSWVVS
jgi:mannose-6-phosphate isomerase